MLLFSHRTTTRPVAARTSHEAGTVVAARESAVDAGLSMFELGGNAVDAAVAAAIVAGVVEPTETTLAGSGFLLMHEPESGPWAVEFGPMAPMAAHDGMFELDTGADPGGVVGLTATVDNRNRDGALAAGVPRTLLGLLTAQRRFGKLSMAQVCEPAVWAAYEGFEADSWFVTSALADLTRLRSDPVTAALFLDSGLPIGSLGTSGLDLAHGARARVTQDALGRTLERVVAETERSLVDGSVAAELVRSARECGGLLTAVDMARAEPQILRPLQRRFRDTTVHVPNAPGGGLSVLQILALWAQLYPDGATGHETPLHARSLALVNRHVFADRYHWLGDPDHVVVPAAELLSTSYLAELADQCRTGADVAGWQVDPPWHTYSRVAAHNPWAADDETAPTWLPVSATRPSSGTTHVSAAGADGQVVSITHTAAHHFGSGVVCPRTGLLFDAAMAWFNAAPGAANSVGPGKRPLANMAPALLCNPDGSAAALGASGGRRIIGAVSQVIINLVDGKSDPAQALSLPRLDASGQQVLLDARRADDLDALEPLGAAVVADTSDPFTMDFARPNIAYADPSVGQTISAIPAAAYSK